MDIYLYDWKEYECGLRMDELSVKCVMYADNQVILALSAYGLQEMVNKLNDSVKKRDLKVNVVKAGYGGRKMKVGSMKEDVVTKIERGMLRWFGHLGRMIESRLTKQIYRANGCLWKGCGWESLMKNVTLGNVTMSHRTRERPAECLASLSHSTMIGLPRAQH
ncbi:hypothetical protein EVAR_37161_1 [Eumeta japonica]|uniref:Reverse transcriptase domain-containing protein n=1 Tax=Eumeta variegata TaxID=151549 RepID=A0A4C1WLK6_EUMVA|nr:hypothetical protein EVAR_37161_1 [Eumeta japonica]